MMLRLFLLAALLLVHGEVRADTPDEITNRLADALQKVFAQPATQDFLKRAKVDLMRLPPAEMRRFQADEVARLQRTADAAGIKPE